MEINKTLKNKKTIIVGVFWLVLAIGPYVAGSRVTVPVYDGGSGGGLRDYSDRYFTTTAQNATAARTAPKTDVVQTILPKTVGGGVERDGYKFMNEIYLVGINWYHLLPLLVLGLAMTIKGLIWIIYRLVLHRMPSSKSATQLVRPNKKK